jgi:hypothetical protein
MTRMSDLYDDDILLWSEQQAELLRRRAASELVNDAELDWPNIAEEIESVGRSELHTVESLLVQALQHKLKAEVWPLSPEALLWRGEARRFRDDAASRLVASMHQRIDMNRIWRRTLRAMPDTVDGPPPPIPADCPVTLEELLAEGD